MAMRQRLNAKKASHRRKGVVKKLSSRPKKKGVDLSDLVGTIELSVDPVKAQRQIRDEWE